jgi:hypothetical protein
MDPVQVTAGIIIGKMPQIDPQVAFEVAFDIVHALGKLASVKVAQAPTT